MAAALDFWTIGFGLRILLVTCGAILVLEPFLAASDAPLWVKLTKVAYGCLASVLGVAAGAGHPPFLARHGGVWMAGLTVAILTPVGILAWFNLQSMAQKTRIPRGKVAPYRL
jgi:hypothetical protein